LIVYLPAGYVENRERHYPVMYMQDGQNLFDPATAFGGVPWRMGETADGLIGEGAIQPLIIVGVWNTGKARIKEYTPSRMPRLGGGKAEGYTRMLMDEVKPFIERQYRVASGPENTGLGGSSLGGLVTLYAGLRFPHVFGKLAALSPSIWWGAGWVNKFAQEARVEPRPRIWLDGGTREGPQFVPRLEKFRDILRGKGWRDEQDLHFEVIEGGEHNEAAWAQRVGPFLRFLFPNR
jgi:enterochelin esterase-like enzyme